MNRKRPHFASFGPEIPIVPVGNFSRIRLTGEQWADLWYLCGPTANTNMNGRSPLPLWKVIAVAYLEGLDHGSHIAIEKFSAEKTNAQTSEILFGG